MSVFKAHTFLLNDIVARLKLNAVHFRDLCFFF